MSWARAGEAVALGAALLGQVSVAEAATVQAKVPAAGRVGAVAVCAAGHRLWWRHTELLAALAADEGEAR